MAKIIALANQKGGTGKTTTAVNLGAALAETGKRVLLVDLDPQGNLSINLGIDIDNLELTIYDVLLNPSEKDEKMSASPSSFGKAMVNRPVGSPVFFPITQIILPSLAFDMDVAPANLDLSGAEVELMTKKSRENILKEALFAVVNEYDFILIDCPPSLSLLSLNALSCADLVIVPVQSEYLAMRSIKQLFTIIAKVKKHTNPNLKTMLLGTMYDRRTVHAKDVIEELRKIFGAQVYQTVIKRTIKFADASVAAEPILSYASNSEAAKDFRQLAKEVLSNGEKTS